MKKKEKHTYRFNPHTLSYEKVMVKAWDKVRGISYTVLFGIVLGTLMLVVGFQIIDSPKERALKREIAQYERQLDKLNIRVNMAMRVLEDLEERDDNLYRTIFEAEPKQKLRDSLALRAEANDILMGYDNSELLQYTTRKVDELTKRLYIQSTSMDEVYKVAIKKQTRMASMPAIMPIDKQKCKLVSGYGRRYHPILKVTRMHTGVDFSAKTGTPIYATGDATVVAAGKNLNEYSGYGIVCVLDHGFGYRTLYAHMHDVQVRQGQKVKRGEQIGSVGSTGMSKGSHLHYEVIQNGKKVNPVYYFFSGLSPQEYEEIIDLANQENQCMS